MQKIFLTLFLIFTLLPVSSAFSQVYDTPSTLTVVLTSQSPFVYKDEGGYTVVVGNVENKNEITSVDNVQIIVKDRKSTRLNSSHMSESRMPSSA